MSTTVLLVEDEKDLLELLAHHLSGAGFRVLTSDRGDRALELARSERPDLILLDIMLPDVQGTDVLRQLRREPGTANTPVMFLTAKGEEVDRIVGFELGADDYVVKPFSPRELLLRVKALLRRAGPDAGEDGQADENSPLERGGIRLDRVRHEVQIQGRKLDLTPLEFRLLSHFMERPGRVLSREHLLDRVWGEGVYVTDRTVDTHVKRLRSKLGSRADLVETVRGIGYRFRE
jgi:two-component system phosphate regulon response regulator PhoB